MDRLSKTRAEEEIKEFFSNAKNKTSEEVKKIKRLSMRHSLKLRELRRKFCKKCLKPYSGNEKIRINNKIKSIECKNCGYASRWKIKLS